ncbi:MAG: hypothetical protein HY985_07205 [Magnetospirillum sp.]|nr:hypothetical protein [Magnetospirillum sp.]
MSPIAVTVWIAAACLAAAVPARAQPEQEARLLPPAATNAAQPYDLVATDRETAWRINRITGEVMVCRIDTTGGLDSVRARCAAATMGGGGPQQSMTPRP